MYFSEDMPSKCISFFIENSVLVYGKVIVFLPTDLTKVPYQRA